MTPLPKRRLSSQRQGKRRHAIKLKLSTVIVCPSCGQPKLPHLVCPSCGKYKNKEVIKKRIPKKAAR